MKRFIICLILLLTVIMNVYLVIYWEPQSKADISQEPSKEVVTYSKSIYKIDKERALEQLSNNDKKELENIIKKLSTFDIGKIKEYYNDSDDEEGIISIFKLLRKRLASEDYKRVEEISSSFLDIKRINEEIKNK
ncbi:MULTISPECIES: hypothetical protein [unclassified Clostridium]|uniref:hypothetical protein n=1 Tax=unclassified Clostridium TaxID=2614128 RepID=UPI0002983785|nr:MULTISPECIES: hypothetical protein [unclassified Clostridium]EKQ50818.1 MAG: hypothetical protein A370_05371 [Clostridium sp. Maddingley MBC34-26]